MQFMSRTHAGSDTGQRGTGESYRAAKLDAAANRSSASVVGWGEAHEHFFLKAKSFYYNGKQQTSFSSHKPFHGAHAIW